MSTSFILALVAVAVSLVAVLLSIRSGPRVTHIETRRDDDDDDEGKGTSP